MSEPLRIILFFIFFVTMAQQPLVRKRLFIMEGSRSHSHTSHSVGLLWTSDQPDAQTSTGTTHNTHDRQTSMPTEEFESTIPASEQPQTHALGRATSLKTKLRGLSPRANYTDRAAAAGRRSKCQLLRVEGCHVVSATIPHGR